MHKTSKAKFRPAAIVAVLLFAGFGCRPILDATQEKQLTVEERRQESIWAKERPTFDFAMEPDGTGKAFVYFKTQPNSTVTMELTGPGVVSEPRQTLPVNEDGSVAFEWKIN